MTKSPRKNVPDVGIELGAACMPSELASDRATAPGYRQSMAFYCTKHEPKVNYFSSEASLSKPPLLKIWPFWRVKNHNEDFNKIAQQEIEMVNLSQ